MQVRTVNLEGQTPETERNKRIMDYLIKNPSDLADVLAHLEKVAEYEHRTIIERFRQMLDGEVYFAGVTTMFKDFALKTPPLFALFVSLAIYKFYR